MKIQWSITFKTNDPKVADDYLEQLIANLKYGNWPEREHFSFSVDSPDDPYPDLVMQTPSESPSASSPASLDNDLPF